jgi:uncharacterized protein (TIRG00374 family)
MPRLFQDGTGKFSIKRIQFLIAAAIIILLVISIHPVALSQVLARVNPFYILLAMALYFATMLIMTYRLKGVLTFLGHKLRYRMVFSSHMAGMICSDVTPARSGYLYAAYELSQKGIPLSTAMVSVTSTYIFDLIFKCLVAAIGVMYFYSSIFPFDTRLFIFMVFGLILLAVLAYSFITQAPPGLRSSLGKYRVFRLLFQYGDEGRTIHRIAPFILSISFLGWILRGLEWYCIAYAVGITSFSPADGLFLNPLLTLLSLVPITPAGIGIQEAGIVGILVLINVDSTSALGFAILNRFTEVLVDAIGLKSFLGKGVKHEDLHSFYNSLDGDIDERGYHSDLFVQRYFQQRRTGTINEHLDVRKGDIFLDIGCGSGVQLAMLAPSGYSLAIGIDVNRKALLYARGRGLPATEFIIADAQSLPIKTGAVQKILCSEVIEHVDRPDILVKETLRVLGKGGELVLTTPNENSPWGLYEIAWDLFGRGRNYGDTHLKFYSPREILAFFRECPGKYVRTLFFISPLVALLNNEALVSAAEKIDSRFERWNLGVLIIARVRKGEPPARVP